MTGPIPSDGRRCDWHVVVDAVGQGTASAVVTVASGLLRAASATGVASYLVVAEDQVEGRSDREGVLRRTSDGRIRAGADTLLKVTSGRTLGWRDRIDLSGAGSRPTHVYLHNQPWLAHPFRVALPDAAIYLYAHNSLLHRVPRRAVRRVMNDLDGVIAVSRYLVDEMVARCDVEPGRMHVVHNAVAAETFDSPQEPGAATVDLAFVGRMVPEKGVHVLIDALADAAERGVRLSARIAGATLLHGPHEVGEYERDLRAKAAARDLDVEFVGYLEPADVPRFMNDARAVVVPSVWPEPLGLVALEALASRAALVCTNSGGMPEVVGDGAVIVEPGDARALADALLEVLADDPARQRLSARGRELARQQSWGRAYSELRLVDEPVGRPA